jgi:hypothetical protein
MDLKHLDKLAKLCKKHGITHLKSQDIELQFDHSITESAVSNLIPPATDIATTPRNPYSTEDALFWSSADTSLNG